MRYVDPDGREAGDVFDSQDEAAKDFAITYNDDSIKNNVELGTYIRQDGNKYFYDIPVAGTESNVKLSRNKDDSSIVAMIHTHGAYTDENQNQVRALEPSIGDINTVKQNKLSLYTVTPDGGLFLSEYTESNKENVINYSFTPKAPSDSNCPYRKNNLDAKNYPDNFFRR